MTLLLSPAKLVLLAVHFAVNGDVDSLAALAARHNTVLRKDLLLRILLTYLPETLPSSHYIDFIRNLEIGAFPDTPSQEVDVSSVESLAEDDAEKKVRKLRLLPLRLPDASVEEAEDLLSLFLVRRSYKVDEEAGLLDELPTLLLPFLDHSPCIRTLLVSAILPLLTRNCEYYPQEPIPYTLQGFRQLPDRVAVNLLLSQTGIRQADLPSVGRDLRVLIGPWLSDERRWRPREDAAGESGGDEAVCPGWEEVLRWLTNHASKNWKVAVSAIQQWDGPSDADLAGWGSVQWTDDQRDHLEQSYAQAALASAYLIPEASLEALEGAYSIVAKVARLRGLEPVSPLASALAVLPPLTEQIPDDIVSARNATCMRNDVLAPSNILTSPSDSSAAFLQALILSANILTKAGCPCTVRRAGELALLQDEREQKAEATKLIHYISNSGPKTDDKFWVKARNEILWLRDWGAEDGWSSDAVPRGIFGQVKREFLEVEILKALLSNTRYALARSIYEDTPDQPLDRKPLQDTIYATAMTAYDNASNPNRTRGGLKKCDDILKAFPKTIQRSDPQAKRIEALLQATHSLSDYRLVLTQGEPFTPVVLRVHTDPISIIGKILEQNPKSYTQLHDLLRLGELMVEAGLTARNNTTLPSPSPAEDESTQRAIAERRITAMCIDAALNEDDFETAYSYVVNRLDSLTTPISIPDDYSWKAALQAGKYRRTARTLPPTHLGTTSANADIRHLEQRIECLSAALRIAPPSTLQEILNAFRRAEEELEAALREEEEREHEWDTRGDALHHHQHMPGEFSTTTTTTTTTTTAKSKPPPARRQRGKSVTADEDAAPMSLFDLSRASVLSAQRNLSALSALPRSAGFGRRLGGGGGGGAGDNNGGGRSSLDQPPLSAAGSVTSAGTGSGGEEEKGAGTGTKRVRKRDQLRDAAVGTLVSGVGWLVGVPPPERTSWE
ncbi:protein transport protein sec39 [Achaetomium macrosporum]|uniref:Protein transport protein sec39 n=1 Tax=Achaetomium macrosporum TaxID=79813 RepID=A0AAN7CHL2_9PEZI|nr:protein transport protein sec39 [Achaetomium macrosporum]